MEKISVIIPCYNEAENIKLVYDEIIKVIKKIKTKYEVIFIDDGSIDESLNIIEMLFKQDKNIKYESFSRNFGKEAAIYAGLLRATGNYAVIMDADMQHDPKIIETMYDHIKEGYDSVATYRKIRKGNIFRNLFSKMFFKIISKLTKIDYKNGEMDYRMMSKKMYDVIIKLEESNRFSKGLFRWVGFNTYWIECDVPKRKYGKSKWKFSSLFKYAVDGIISFSTSLLLISIFIGLLFVLFSFILLVIIIVSLLLKSNVSSLLIILLFMFLIGGFIMIFIGIIGEYISKIYIESKKRPIYISKRNEKDI